MMKPYRLKNIKTGLYYQPSSSCNFSTKGKVYFTKANVISPLSEGQSIAMVVAKSNIVFNKVKEAYIPEDWKDWRGDSLDSYYGFKQITLRVPIEDFMIEPLEQKLTEDCEHDFVTKFGETYCQECGMSEVDFIHNNEAAPKKLITAFVREHFDRLMNEEISFSRFVEILNEEVDLIKRRKK